MVKEIVRRRLVVPDGLARIDVAREDSGRPLVVAGPLVGVPRAGIANAIINELGCGIIADPAPDRPAPDLPGFRRPGLDAEVLPLVHCIKWVETGADEDVLVGSRVEGAPGELAAALVER